MPKKRKSKVASTEDTPLTPVTAKEDGTLYFIVRFKDKTDFSLRYAYDMFVVGADFCATSRPMISR